MAMRDVLRNRRRFSIISVEIMNGATIAGFVEDEEAFNNWVKKRFATLVSPHPSPRPKSGTWHGTVTL